eukprot:Skav209934  [mRNA]  locus=scaffold102:101562:104861:+ [translate_table: standard]
MMIFLSDRFAETWNGPCKCLLNFLQTLLVFAAILMHSAAGILAAYHASTSRHVWKSNECCFFLFLAILVLTNKLSDKLQVHQKKLQKARSFQLEDLE